MIVTGAGFCFSKEIAMTLAQHLSKLNAYGMNFMPNIMLDASIQVRNIEHSRNEVYMRYLTKQEELFRTSQTLADGDPLPVDWVINANRTYTTSGGINTPFVLIDLSQIGDVTVNPFLKGTTSYPRYFYCDQKFNTVPPSMSNCIHWYYKRPPLLWADPLVLSTDDGMPADTADDITLGAFERNLQVLLDEADALGLTKAQLDEVRKAERTFYTEVYKQEIEPTRNR